MRIKRANILVLSLITICGVFDKVLADEQSILQVHGYGTMGIVHSDDKQADYIPDLFDPNGVGHTRDWSVDIDSRLGLQISAEFSPKLSAVLQLVSEKRYDNSYTPIVEWANVNYKVTPDFDVRVGRIREAFFLFADTRKVGYTYPWVRPPTELYRLLPVSSLDGLDMSYKFHFKNFSNTLSLTYGQLDFKQPERLDGGTNKSRESVAINNVLEYGPALFTASYTETLLTLPVMGELFDAFRQFGPEGVAIAQRFDSDSRRVSFLTFGMNYDPGQWFAIAEWARADFNSVVRDSVAWYISGGYRFGLFTPFVSYADLNALGDRSHPGLTLSALPPEQVGLAAGLNAAFNDILIEAAEQKTVAVGLRWDFMSNAALKFQYEYIHRSDNSPGTFVDFQPGFKMGGTANLFSASIDFVF